MISKRKKSKIISEFSKSKKDTGSIEVQIGVLSERINELVKHLKKNPKDKHSRIGLLKMVDKRRKFLNYIRKNSPDTYSKIVKKLGLKEK